VTDHERRVDESATYQRYDLDKIKLYRYR